MNNIVIAIDGPAAAGKSFLGRAIARHYDILYIDSGGIYRALAYKVLAVGVLLNRVDAIVEVVRSSVLEFSLDLSDLSALLDGRDFSNVIRSSGVTQAAAIVAQVPQVREIVKTKLRGVAQERSIVIDGRSIGTSVFPDAQIKIYLDAPLAVRALRRWKEQYPNAPQESLEAVKADLEMRDQYDRSRSIDPLVKAEDAVVISTATMTPDDVVNTVLKMINCKSDIHLC